MASSIRKYWVKKHKKFELSIIGGLKYIKALVKYSKGPGNMEIREVPEPKPGPGEVKIEVKAAGISIKESKNESCL